MAIKRRFGEKKGTAKPKGAKGQSYKKKDKNKIKTKSKTVNRNLGKRQQQVAMTKATLLANTVDDYSYLIYKSGSTYYAKNGITGNLHSTTSTNNIASVLNAVIIDVNKAGGGVIRKRPGTFDVKKTGTIEGIHFPTQNRIIFQGAGIGATKLVCTEAGTYMFIKNNNTTTSDIVFRDLTVDGANISAALLNTANNSSRIVLERTEWTRGNLNSPQVYLVGNDVTIKDSVFTAPNNSGDLCGLFGSRILVDNCYFSRTVSGGGLTTGGSSETVVRNCKWKDYVGYGAISLENISAESHNVVIEGCQFVDSATAGSSILTLSGASTDTTQDYNSLTIKDCQFENSGYIKIGKFVHTLNIHDCEFRNSPNTINPIYIASNCREINIHDNIIKNVTGAQGMIVEIITDGSVISKMANIHNNTFSGIDQAGLEIRGIQNCSIHDNRFFDVGRSINNAYSGIFIRNIDAGASVRDKIQIYNNQFDVSQQANRLAYGIQTSSDTTNTVIYQNRIPATAFTTAAIETNAAAGVTLINSGTV